MTFMLPVGSWTGVPVGRCRLTAGCQVRHT